MWYLTKLWLHFLSSAFAGLAVYLSISTILGLGYWMKTQEQSIALEEGRIIYRYSLSLAICSSIIVHFALDYFGII
jgi:hypothetical protein